MRSRSLFSISLLVLAALVALAGTSCSTGPAPPRPGTPAFYWDAAKQNYKTGDIQKTEANLADIISTDNEFSARARAFEIVISAALLQGFHRLADSFEEGSKANKANPMPLHKQVITYRHYASAAALQLVQTTRVFLDKDKDPNVALAFDYPGGTAAEPPALKKVATGAMLPDGDREALQNAVLKRAMLLSVCHAVGAGEDSAKAADQFKGEVLVPREVFLVELAKTFDEQSDLFGPKNMAEPDHQKLMLQQALNILKGVPETKDTKALAARLQVSLKKIGGGAGPS